MDFGGLIAGALGGGARAVEGMSSDILKRRDEEQTAILGERRRAMLNREEAAYAAAEKLKGEEVRMQRYADSADKVDVRAKEIGTRRDVGTANRVAPSVDEGTLSIIKDRLSPQEQEKYYGVKQNTGSGLIQDKINAAREIGADPALRKDLGDEYKGAVTKEFDQTKLDQNERRVAETERNNREDQKLAARRLEGVLLSKSASPTAKSEAMLNLNTTVSTQQKIIKDGEERIRLLSKTSPEYSTTVDEIRQAREISDIASKAIRGKLTGEDAPARAEPAKPAAAKPPVAALPAGAKKVGTSNGRDVYETPDGKRFISK